MWSLLHHALTLQNWLPPLQPATVRLRTAPSAAGCACCPPSVGGGLVGRALFGLPGRRLRQFPQLPPISLSDHKHLVVGLRKPELLEGGAGEWSPKKPRGLMQEPAALACRELLSAQFLFSLPKLCKTWGRVQGIKWYLADAQ